MENTRLTYSTIIFLGVLLVVAILPTHRDIQLIKDQNEQIEVISEQPDTFKVGIASWYEYCIGDWCNTNHNTCAVRHLVGGELSDPLGIPIERAEYLVLTNNETGNKSVCIVTDYGPEYAVHPDRIIDLSPKVFEQLSSFGYGSSYKGLLYSITVDWGWDCYTTVKDNNLEFTCTKNNKRIVI